MTTRNLDAYYYCFEPTGCDEVDAILESVAQAGAGYHSTADWNERREDGSSPLSNMQRAAEESAAQIKIIISERDQLKEKNEVLSAEHGSICRKLYYKTREFDQLKAERDDLKAHSEELTMMRKAHGFDSWSAVLVEIDRLKTVEPVGCIIEKFWFEGSPKEPKLNPESHGKVKDGDLLYLMPGPCSELAVTVMEILRTVKDIPDGLYAKAKHLATQGKG